ncbi:hypothetical protein ABZS88_45405 [Streptomyces sp. NPDC005480]|uniref:hypothetical protein n=1 Tax=Streptomyces sp. NPDC005480 TaxID=3154880 RepID=UPI0033B7D36E
MDATFDDSPHSPPNDTAPQDSSLSLNVPDHYFLAYQEYVRTHGQEPRGAAAFSELSARLASQGIHGVEGRPVSPSTLRRYALEQRIYRRWTDERELLGKPPEVDALLERLAGEGVTAANKRPVDAADIHRAEGLVLGFERRYQALRAQRANTQG